MSGLPRLPPALPCLAASSAHRLGAFRPDRIQSLPPQKDHFYALNYMLERIQVGSVLVALVVGTSQGLTLSLRNSLLVGRSQHSPLPSQKHFLLGLKDADVPHSHRWNFAELDSRLKELGLGKGRHGINYELSNAGLLSRLQLRYSKMQDIQNEQWAKDLYSAGLDMQEQKEYGQALSQFDTAIHFDPSLYHAYIAKACLLVNQHKYQKAMDCLLVISRLQPHNQQVLNYMHTVTQKYHRFKDDLKLVNKNHFSPKEKYLF